MQRGGERREGDDGARSHHVPHSLIVGSSSSKCDAMLSEPAEFPPALRCRLYTRHQPPQLPFVPAARVDRAPPVEDAVPSAEVLSARPSVCTCERGVGRASVEWWCRRRPFRSRRFGALEQAAVDVARTQHREPGKHGRLSRGRVAGSRVVSGSGRARVTQDVPSLPAGRPRSRRKTGSQASPKAREGV